MATFRKFEELECWQLSRKLVFEIYQKTNQAKISKDFGFKDQIRRASLSVMNNIAEGQSRFTHKQFVRYLEIANGSCAEVKSMLYLMRDFEYLTEKEIKPLFEMTNKTQAKLLALVKYLKSNIRTP